MSNEIFEGYQLSPQQKRLWLLQQEESGFPYLVQGVVMIEGKLNAPALKKAMEEIVARNEILRTSFHCLPGMTIPLQVIGDGGVELGEDCDLTHLSPAEQGDKIDALLQDARRSLHDSGQEKPLRISVCALSELKHALLLSLPSVSADARSLNIMVAQVAEYYGALDGSSGRASEPLRYIVISEWLNELLESEEAEPGRQYWKQLGDSYPPALAFPFERQGRAAGFDPQTISVIIDPTTHSRLTALAAGLDCSLADALLGCWQVLLWRLSGQSVITVGVCFDGRTDEELEGAIGPLARHLPIGCVMREELSFDQVLTTLREAMREAEAWQEAFSWDRYAGAGSNAWPACFEFNTLTGVSVAGGVSFSLSESYSCAERFKLKLSCALSGGSLKAEFHYDSSLVSGEDARRIADQFQTLLSNVAGNGRERIFDYEIVSPDQRRQLLLQFNQTGIAYPSPPGIHTFFEQQASRTPNNIAAIFEQQEVAYEELNARANQLARRLRAAGVGPESLVPVCVERSLNMMTALLGVLKAGGACVPLDPDYPASRLAFMLEDCGAGVLLTEERLAERLSPRSARVIYIDSDWESIGREDRADLDSGVTPDNLAYLIYTSGSTGKPKGAMNTHRGICNRQIWMQNAFRFTETDRILQLASFSFDFSIWEFLGPSSAGAAVVIPRSGGHRDAAYLIELIEKHRITVAHFVPSMLKAFLQERELERCKSLRHVFCGGEALTRELQEQFFATFSAELHNQYGPTEASIDVTHQACERGGHSVPIGRPTANNRIYLLDTRGRPSPIWTQGELHIGGVAVGRGYLNNPDLTAERFIPDPFSPDPGARMYKTGDLARYLPNGNIEYFGRIDHQVKIRGFRIETGEIEAALARHPALQEAVVVARDDSRGEKRLVAYVVPEDKALQGVSQLRAFLNERLPDYMIPSLFVTLPEIPLSPNGKVDRLALPAPDETRPELSKAFVAPRTLLEELIEGIWRNLLALDLIGVHDNFFELGGHSLLATQLVSRLREVARVDLPVRHIFDSPTIAKLAEQVEAAIKAGQKSQVPPLKRAAREEPFPLSYAQQRLWFLDQLEPASPAYNIPTAIRLSGPLDIPCLERSFNRVISRHEILRTVFSLRDGEPVQVVRPHQPISIEVVDLTGLEQESRQEAAMREAGQEASRGFDLSQGPMLRVKAVKVDEQEHVVVMTMHHIVSDAWSMRVLVKEVTEGYDRELRGDREEGEELEIQYGDYAAWERGWLKGEAMREQEEYWREKLEGVKEVRLGGSREEEKKRGSRRGGHERVEIGAGVSERLKEVSRKEGVTLFMTMLAAFQTLLYRYSGQDDIAVGTPALGRNRRELENLIGFFINTLVMRTDLSGNPSFKELLKRVRETALGAYAHQEMPFEKMVEDLRPERDPGRMPLVNVWFALHQFEAHDVELPGLSLSAIEVPTTMTKLDLALILTDTPDSILAAFWYDSDLFDAETIAGMVRSFEALLVNVVENIDMELLDIPLPEGGPEPAAAPSTGFQNAYDEFRF